MIYLLAQCKLGKEFATADAINGLGALKNTVTLAVAPRRVGTRPRKDGKGDALVDLPLLPGILFIAIEPDTWHRIRRREPWHILRDGLGNVLRAPVILEEIKPRKGEAVPSTWVSVQGFVQRAEQEAQRQEENFEAGLRVRRYRKGDRLRIVGDMLHGQLRGYVVNFVGLDDKGKIVAEVEGMQMLGKPVKVTLNPQDAVDWAAE